MDSPSGGAVGFEGWHRARELPRCREERSGQAGGRAARGAEREAGGPERCLSACLLLLQAPCSATSSTWPFSSCRRTTAWKS